MHRSHPARGAWIKTVFGQDHFAKISSHPTMGAWIKKKEEFHGKTVNASLGVCNDANALLSKRPSLSSLSSLPSCKSERAAFGVAPREGCVDLNLSAQAFCHNVNESPTPRRVRGLKESNDCVCSVSSSDTTSEKWICLRAVLNYELRARQRKDGAVPVRKRHGQI